MAKIYKITRRMPVPFQGITTVPDTTTAPPPVYVPPPTGVYLQYAIFLRGF